MAFLEKIKSTYAFNPQSWNLYSYVNGNPINFNDPSGHFGNPPGWTKATLYGPGGALGLSPAYGGMWENPQEKGTLSGVDAGYYGGAEYSGSELGYWEQVPYRTGYGTAYYNSNGELMTTEPEEWFYGATWVFRPTETTSWLEGALRLANRAMASAPALPLLMFGSRIRKGNYGTTIVENKFINEGWLQGTPAITLGNFIFIDETGIDPNCWYEEYGHVEQWEEYGPYLYLIYVMDWVNSKFSYYDMTLERQAKTKPKKPYWPF